MSTEQLLRIAFLGLVIFLGVTWAADSLSIGSVHHTIGQWLGLRASEVKNGITVLIVLLVLALTAYNFYGKK